MIDGLMRFVGSAVIVILCSQYTAVSFSIPPSVALCSAVTTSTAAQDKSQTEARRIWEEAIAAKGGRELLYDVHNVLISSLADYITHKGRKNRLRSEYLFVFPNKYWFYEDYGKDVFGVRMHMFDYDEKVEYVGARGSPETKIEATGSRIKTLDNGPISLLLETKWLKPIPIKATAGRIGSNKVDVVETAVNGRRVDFAFDQKAHLPVQVSFYNKVGDKTSIDVQRFSDYTEVNGTKVPQTVKLSDGTVDKSVIQFNVKYNEDIFTKPPAKADPEAWRPKNKE